jgi:hypothetical protein
VACRAQSGDLIDGVWKPGSFDVPLKTADIEGAKVEIYSRLARGEGTSFETGEWIRVFGDGQYAYRHIREEGIDASWT